MKSIKKQAINAIKWTSVSAVLSQIFVVSISIVKYRLIGPEAFGIMAVATSSFSILRMVQTMGYGPAIVQQKEVSKQFENSVFWVIMAISIFLAALVAVSAGWLAKEFEANELSVILPILSALFVVDGYSTMHQYLLSRDLKHKYISLANLSSTIVGGSVVVALAFYGFGVWSLVYGAIASSLTTATLYSRFGDWRPKMEFDVVSIKAASKFSMFMTVNKFVSILRQNIPQLVIGKVLGTEMLGLFTFARNLILLVMNKIDAMMQAVLFPMFSKLQSDDSAISSVYHRINHYTFILLFPFLGGFLLIGHEFIEIVYGPEWLEALLIAKIVLIATVIQSVFSKGSSIIGAKGKPEILVKIEVLIAIPTLVLIFVAVQYGIIPTVVVMAGAAMVALFFQISELKKLVGLKVIGYFQSMQYPLIATTVMFLGLKLLLRSVLPFPHDVITLAGSVGLGAFLYCSVLLIFEWSEIKTAVIQIIKS